HLSEERRAVLAFAQIAKRHRRLGDLAYRLARRGPSLRDEHSELDARALEAGHASVEGVVRLLSADPRRDACTRIERRPALAVCVDATREARGGLVRERHTGRLEVLPDLAPHGVVPDLADERRRAFAHRGLTHPGGSEDRETDRDHARGRERRDRKSARWQEG